MLTNLEIGTICQLALDEGHPGNPNHRRADKALLASIDRQGELSGTNERLRVADDPDEILAEPAPVRFAPDEINFLVIRLRAQADAMPSHAEELRRIAAKLALCDAHSPVE